MNDALATCEPRSRRFGISLYMPTTTPSSSATHDCMFGPEEVVERLVARRVGREDVGIASGDDGLEDLPDGFARRARARRSNRHATCASSSAPPRSPCCPTPACRRCTAPSSDRGPRRAAPRRRRRGCRRSPPAAAVDLVAETACSGTPALISARMTPIGQSSAPTIKCVGLVRIERPSDRRPRRSAARRSRPARRAGR